MTSAPPTALAELQAWPHWVCWRTTERDGKPTKVPLQPNGRPASSTDPSTWSTHAECVAAAERRGYDGIGYVFAPDDEYVGIDLDKCVLPDDGTPFARALGPIIHADARQFIDELASYTELSPTGTGLHIIVRGRFPEGGRNRTSKTPWGGEFECYDRARFFTITGLHIPGTPETIESRTEELAAVHSRLFPVPATAKSNGFLLGNGQPKPSPLGDVALEEKIRSSKQGPKFAELFDRGAGENGGASEADLALSNILAFWVGRHGPAEIDRWFRRSALMRAKWDEKRGDTTYGGYTINRALEGRTEFYGQKTAEPAKRQTNHDNTEMSYAEEISSIFGLIDDPIISGWRSSKKATARVVLTTRSGVEFEVDNWRAATSSPPVLAQEIEWQLGVEASLKKEDIKRLNMLVGKFCDDRFSMTARDRAHELGLAFLQEAEEVSVELSNTDDRWAAFKKVHDRNPATWAKAEGTSLSAACFVLLDKSGKRYVRIQWFVDYVKANVVAGTATAVLDHIEEPGGWNRIQNAKSRMKATDPETKDCIWLVLYEVPVDWVPDPSDPE